MLELGLQAAFADWHKKVTEEKAWSDPVQNRELRSNRKNTEMEFTLNKYQSARNRLNDEIATWKDTFSAVQLSQDSGEETITANESAEIDNAPDAACKGASADPLASDLDMQVEVVETFVKKCNAMLNIAEKRKAAVTTKITTARFQGYPAIDDPRALIAAVGSAS